MHMARMFALALLVIPGITFAHTRWFADGDLAPYISQEPTSLYLAVWACIAFVFVMAGVVIEKKGWFRFSFITPKAGHAFPRAASTFSMVAGTFFMIAGTHEYLFSPNITHEIGLPMWMVYAQFLIGLLFLLGIYARIAAIVLGAIYLLSTPYVGFVMSIENIWVLSTALFIMIMGNDYFSIVSFRAMGKYVQHLKPYALPLLRLGTGATLMVLGFSEKILRPEFGIHFLENHPWNFMAMLGLNYSDYLFTLSAGSVEALLGLMLVLGLAVRVTTLVIAVFFTIPLFILGPIELAGHVPHFAAVIVLLLFGGGSHWKLLGGRS